MRLHYNSYHPVSISHCSNSMVEFFMYGEEVGDEEVLDSKDSI